MMKRILTIFMSGIISLAVSAQANIQQYDVINHIYGTSNAQPVLLEKARGIIQEEAVGFGGIGKVNRIVHIDGLSSPAVIPSGESLVFYINTGNELPAFDLFPVKVNKRQNKRYAIILNASTFKAAQAGKDAIPVMVSKVADGLYKLSISTALESGEYLFTPKGNAHEAGFDVFSFRVE